MKDRCRWMCSSRTNQLSLVAQRSFYAAGYANIPRSRLLWSDLAHYMVQTRTIFEPWRKNYGSIFYDPLPEMKKRTRLYTYLQSDQSKKKQEIFMTQPTEVLPKWQDMSSGRWWYKIVVFSSNCPCFSLVSTTIFRIMNSSEKFHTTESRNVNALHLCFMLATKSPCWFSNKS